MWTCRRKERPVPPHRPAAPPARRPRRSPCSSAASGGSVPAQEGPRLRGQEGRAGQWEAQGLAAHPSPAALPRGEPRPLLGPLLAFVNRATVSASEAVPRGALTKRPAHSRCLYKSLYFPSGGTMGIGVGRGQYSFYLERPRINLKNKIKRPRMRGLNQDVCIEWPSVFTPVADEASGPRTLLSVPSTLEIQ